MTARGNAVQDEERVRALYRHVTSRVALPDGRWVRKCSCGLESAPVESREMLGWDCPAAREVTDGGR